MTFINADSDEDRVFDRRASLRVCARCCRWCTLSCCFFKREKKTSSVTSPIYWRKVFTNYKYMH